jgi:hypothetical protein
LGQNSAKRQNKSLDTFSVLLIFPVTLIKIGSNEPLVPDFFYKNTPGVFFFSTAKKNQSDFWMRFIFVSTIDLLNDDRKSPAHVDLVCVESCFKYMDFATSVTDARAHFYRFWIWANCP